MPVNRPSAIIFSALASLLGWVLFRALATGALTVVRGTKSPLATREDRPIIYWGFVLLNAAIFLRLLLSALQAWGFAIPI
jgi:hypothetical protein